MKKLLLGLGSIAAVVAPIAAVVSCGSDDLNLGDQGTGSGDGTNTGGAGTTDTDPSTAGTVIADSGKVTKLKTDFIASGLVSGILASDITAVRSGGAYNDGTVEAEASISFEITASGKTLVIHGSTDDTHTLSASAVTITILAQAERDNGVIKPGGDEIDSLGYMFVGSGTEGPSAITNPQTGTQIKNNVEALFEITGYKTPSTSGGNTGNTGGSGTGTGTGTAVVTTDLTEPAGTNYGAAWHGVFHKASGRSLPAVNDIFKVTPTGHAEISYTWTAADNTALAGFTANPHTMSQDDVVNYLAKKLAGETTGSTAVTADEVKTAFGITSATTGATAAHAFTTGTSGAPVVTTESLSSEIAQFVAATSSKDEATLATALTGKTTVTAAELGYTEPSLTGITATYTITGAYSAGTLTVNVTLAKAGATVTNNTGSFVLTPKATTTPAAVNLSTELAKFADATSSKDEATMKAAITATTLTTAALGFGPTTALSSDVTATFAVKTPFAAGKVVLTVTLAKAGASSVTNNTKDITITAAATDLSSYAPTAATSSKNEATLATALTGKTTVTAAELGFTEPANWATDKVTATYTITTYTAGPITVNFVLAKAGASTVTRETGTFVLTPVTP